MNQPGCFGRVAGVGVFRQKADETALELLVQGGQDEWQHRLGHARARGQSEGVRLQPLEREQLPDERMQARGGPW